MDAHKWLMGELEAVCLKLFPGSLVEIQESPVGIWAFVLGPDGNWLNTDLVLEKIKQYETFEDGERRAIAQFVRAADVSGQELENQLDWVDNFMMCPDDRGGPMPDFSSSN